MDLLTRLVQLMLFSRSGLADTRDSSSGIVLPPSVSEELLLAGPLGLGIDRGGSSEDGEAAFSRPRQAWLRVLASPWFAAVWAMPNETLRAETTVARDDAAARPGGSRRLRQRSLAGRGRLRRGSRSLRRDPSGDDSAKFSVKASDMVGAPAAAIAAAAAAATAHTGSQGMVESPSELSLGKMSFGIQRSKSGEVAGESAKEAAEEAAPENGEHSTNWAGFREEAVTAVCSGALVLLAPFRIAAAGDASSTVGAQFPHLFIGQRAVPPALQVASVATAPPSWSQSADDMAQRLDVAVSVLESAVGCIRWEPAAGVVRTLSLPCVCCY